MKVISKNPAEAAGLKYNIMVKCQIIDILHMKHEDGGTLQFKA